MITRNRARMPSCLIDDLVARADMLELAADQAGLAGAPEVMTLLEVLTLVPDPRDRRGLRHSWTVLLGPAMVAVRCGAIFLAGIIRRARGADVQLLVALGVLPVATTLGHALRDGR